MRRRIHVPRPQPAMLVALIAMVFAAGGTSYAALQITSGQIKNETITSHDIKNRTLQTADLSTKARAALKGNRGATGLSGPKGDPGSSAKLPAGLMWIDHFSFLPGDASVQTSFNSTTSGIGGGLTALVIGSTTTGENANSGGNKDVQRSLEVPPGYTIKSVRVCYELTNSRSFISQIRLAQIEPTPSSALVNLDDATDQTATGPVCVNSAATNVDASGGAVLISLRVNFGNTGDKIALRAVGLNLAPTA
jgi:hypothetical protein